MICWFQVSISSLQTSLLETTPSPLGGLVGRPGMQSCHLNTSFAFLLNWIPYSYSWMSGLLALSLVLSVTVGTQTEACCRHICLLNHSALFRPACLLGLYRVVILGAPPPFTVFVEIPFAFAHVSKFFFPLVCFFLSWFIS